MQNRLQGRCLWATLIAVLVLSQTSNAESSSTKQIKQVSLQEALSKTLKSNPDLAIYPYKLRAADAAYLQAGVRPSTRISLEAENLAGSSPATGTRGAEITLALSQVIELGNKRDQRSRVADVTRQKEQQAYNRARLKTLSETVRRYIQLAASQAYLELAKRSLNLAKQDLQDGKRRVHAGAAPESELTRLSLATQRVALSVERARLDCDTAGQKLAALWGNTESTQLRANTNLRPLPALPVLASIQERIKQAPEILALISEAQLREAEIRLARANGVRDLEITLGTRHDRLSDENTLIAGFSLPLNLHNPNRGNIARAQAELEMSKTLLQARRIQMESRLLSLYRKLEIMREEFTLIEKKSLPLAQQLYQEIKQGYAAGRYSLLDLTSARREQLLLEKKVIDLATAFHLQINEIERLTGIALTAVGKQEKKS